MMFVCLCGLQVIECNEDYTSKTCGQCGLVNENPRAQKSSNAKVAITSQAGTPRLLGIYS